jgi:hypothetical protein
MKAMNIMKKILLTGLAVLSLGLAMAPKASAQGAEGHGIAVKSETNSFPLVIMRGGGGKDGQETHG